VGADVGLPSDWTPSEREIAIRLRATRASMKGISEALRNAGYERTPSAVSRFLCRNKGSLTRELEAADKWRMPDSPIKGQPLRTTWGDPLCVKRLEVEFGRGTGLVPVAIVPDTHCPEQDDWAVELACKVIETLRPVAVVHLGDFRDFPQISRFDKDPARYLRIHDDIAVCNDVRRRLQSAADATTPWYELLGNHDHRWMKYLWGHPEIAGLRQMQYDAMFGLDENFQVIRNLQLVEQEICWRGRFVFKHGEYVSSQSGYTAKRELDKEHVSGASGHCFDEETEILTPTGWKRHADLEVGCPVLTLNAEKDVLEWNLVEEIFRYDDKKELIRLKSRDADLLVTPEHGLVRCIPDARPREMVGFRRSGTSQNGKYRFRTAEQCFERGMYIPLAGRVAGQSAAISDDQLRFVVWVLAEGHIDRRSHCIRLTQSDAPDGRLRELRGLLSRLGISHSCTKRYNAGETEHGVYRNYDAYVLNIHNAKDIWPWLSTLIDYDKNVLGPMWGLSPDQIDVLFEAWILTDGNYNKAARNSAQISAVRRTHIDYLQAMAVMSGRRTAVASRSRNGSDYFVMTVNTRSTTKVQKTHWSRVCDHSGPVWCVSVANGTLVVRRGGHTMITQNTHRIASYLVSNRRRPLAWTECGCLCSLDPAYMTNPNWQQGMAVGWFNGDGKNDYFHVDPLPFAGYRTICAGQMLEVKRTKSVC
jgi:hypothetical protein